MHIYCVLYKQETDSYQTVDNSQHYPNYIYSINDIDHYICEWVCVMCLYYIHAWVIFHSSL